MIAKQVIDRQLRDIGVAPRFFGRAELRELSHILFEGEIIRHLIVGHYEGGWATLCATDRRVLLVDKKPFYLTIEDIRYDMVSDVQYNYRLLNGSICLGTVHKTIRFIGYNHEKLRALTNYVQEQVMHARSQPGQATEPPHTEPAESPQYVTLSREAYRQLQAQDEGDAPNMLARTQVSPLNPYKKTPVIMRRRIPRFYSR